MAGTEWQHVRERARAQVHLWDSAGPPELEQLRERAETLIDILRAVPETDEPAPLAAVLTEIAAVRLGGECEHRKRADECATPHNGKAEPHDLTIDDAYDTLWDAVQRARWAVEGEPGQDPPAHLRERELGAVLAALRLWQAVTEGRSVAEAVARIDASGIATYGGEFDALSAQEIDTLCERLNMSVPAAVGVSS